LLSRPDTVIVGDSWANTGKLDYGLHGDPPAICLNIDCREYAFARPAAAAVGKDVLIIAPRQTQAGIDAAYGHLFVSIDTLAPLVLRPLGRPPVVIPLFLGHQLQAPP
jgi:hypothetical protein